MRQSTFMVLI